MHGRAGSELNVPDINPETEALRVFSFWFHGFGFRLHVFEFWIFTKDRRNVVDDFGFQVHTILRQHIN